MKILYLHGYNGKPNKKRIKYLEDLGHEVIAPYIDYNNEPNIFIELIELEYECIIGNSLGGYLAFYISKYKSIKAICINPPLHTDLKINIIIPNTKELPIQKPCSVILGMEDEVVKPKKVIDWLIHNKPYCDLHVYDGVGHKYSINNFIKMINPIINKCSEY